MPSPYEKEQRFTNHTETPLTLGGSGCLSVEGIRVLVLTELMWISDPETDSHPSTKAVRAHNQSTLMALLSLGASPDYRDRCGLTPLYHSVLTGGDTSCCETLLYYRAQLGVRDENGWDESHQIRHEETFGEVEVHRHASMD
ncbi:SH3 and multiple ankyrin repeat domains protein 3-like, partial [Pimephales promelas]|uniref:SH3 and multiple ankyrin repeat domains protein 3-like n=1 Tax=Pimephales promelas TaxID=90988 RepID=UPI001955B8FF